MMPHLLRRVKTLLQRRRIEAEMAEEMRFHLEQRSAEYAEDGMTPDESRFAAERKFGNVGRLQEEARDTFGWGPLERLVRDVRFAARELVRSPGFTLLAVVTLGLGIGANTSMFSILNGVLLKPLPYGDVSQLDRLYRQTAQDKQGNFAAADVIDFRRSQTGYADVAAYGLTDMSLSEPGRPAEVASVARASVNLLALLATQPQRGRDFRPGDDTPGRDRIVIISQRTWQNRFGGRDDIIGHVIRLDGAPHEIVGVLPASFNDWRYLGGVDVFRPLAFTPAEAADRYTTTFRLVGRRAPGRTREDVAPLVRSFGERLAADYPDANADSTWRIVPLQIVAAGTGGVTVVPMLIGLSGFVLLIACSNLANLLLARTMSRAREFAVRAALGASRAQLLRPLVIESLLLALAGAGMALFIAYWFRDWAAMRSTGDNGEQVVFSLDWRVAVWAFGASVVTAVAFGIAPALFALRLDLNDTLKSGGRTATGTRGHQRFRHALIVGQFALAMVLLAGAGFFMRGLHELNERRSGWDSHRSVTGTLVLPAAKYSDGEKVAAFQRLALERIAAVPGVAVATVASYTPFFNWPEVRKYQIAGRERAKPGQEPAAAVNAVGPGYFEAAGTRLVAGRPFAATDTATSPKVYIVSHSTARTFFGDANPLGQRIARVEDDRVVWGEVIGVARDVESVEADRRLSNHQVYQAMAQEPRRQFGVIVRSDGVAPAALVDGVRAVLTELDPDLPIQKLQPAEITIARVNYQLAVLRDLLSAIALLGLGLATLGVYGIISRTMAQRTSEFAIRLALGACIADLTRLVLGSGVRLALIGAGLGLLGAYGVSQVLASQFPDMRTHDLAVLISTTLLLVGVALVACWLPAQRASRVNPVDVLRAE